MEEETTTNSATQDTGAQVAQPETTSEEAAVETTTETTETVNDSAEETQGDSSESEDSFDFNGWLDKKGIDPSTPEGREAIAKSWRGMEQKMHQSTARTGEMERKMTEMSDVSAQQVADATGQDAEIIKRLQAMEVKDSIRNFFDANPDARKYETEMAKIAESAGLYGSADAILKASYAMARANDTSAMNAAKSEGAQQALRNLAQKQSAAVPTGAATNSGTSPKEKPFSELSIAEMESRLGFAQR